MASGALFAAATALDMSTQGIENLIRRRLPEYASKFRFSLVNPTQDWGVNDSYNVSSTHYGRLLVQGTTLSALSKGSVRPERGPRLWRRSWLTYQSVQTVSLPVGCRQSGLLLVYWQSPKCYLVFSMSCFALGRLKHCSVEISLQHW